MAKVHVHTDPVVQLHVRGHISKGMCGRKPRLAAGFVLLNPNLAIILMAVINASCLNVQRDPETGCAYDCGGSNTYQACRQAFYLKQQNEILKESQNQVRTTPTPSSIVEIKSDRSGEDNAIQISGNTFYLLGAALAVGVLIGFILTHVLKKS